MIGSGSGMFKDEMFNRINYYWRLIATAISFSIFGLGGVLLSLTIFPVVNLLIWNQKRRKVVGQYIVHLSFRFFIGFMNRTGILDYEIIGREKLDGQPCLILANHPSLIDVVFLISFMKKVDCIVKQSLLRNPMVNGLSSRCCVTRLPSARSGLLVISAIVVQSDWLTIVFRA